MRALLTETESLGSKTKWLIMAILMLVAAWPRFQYLGGTSFQQNEDYVVLASRGILETGQPILPSEVIYARAVPFSYAVAGASSIFGENEFSARLPSAVMSTLGVGVLFVLALRVFGLSVAVLAASVLALSSWDIVVGRTARMYGPLSFLVLTSVLFMYLVIFEGRQKYRIPSLITGVLACTLHQLGGVLVLAYGALLFLRQNSKPARNFILASILALFAATAGVKVFVSHHYGQWHSLVEESRATLAEAHVVGGEAPASGHRGHFALLDVMASQVGLGSMALVIWVIGVAAGLTMLACVLVTRDGLFLLAVFLATVALGAHQVMAGCYVALGYSIVAFFRGSSFWLRRSLILFVLVGIGAAAWFAFGVLGPEQIPARTVLRLIVGYPTNFLLHHVARNPTMFAVACVGCAHLLYRFRADRADAAGVYVVATLFLAAAAMGMHPTAMDRFYARYVSFLNPYVVVLYCYGIWWISGVAIKYLGRRQPVEVDLLRVATVVGLLFLTGGIQPWATIAAATPHHGSNSYLINSSRKALHFPDNRSVSRYVCENAAKEDVIVATDILAHYAYCPRADYQLTYSKKGDAEGWIGVRSYQRLEDLFIAALETDAQTIWIVVSEREIRMRKLADKDDLLLRLLQTPCVGRVLTGGDDVTALYRLERSCVSVTSKFSQHVKGS